MSSPDAPGSNASSSADEAVGVTTLGIWGLAWPTMLVMGAGTIVRLTDIGMVGDLGKEATAAIGVGGGFYWLIESLTAIAPAGVTALLARAVGAGDRSLADAAHKQGQLQGLALGVVGCAIVFPATELAISFYGVEQEVIVLGSDYLWWRLWGTLPLSIGMVFGAALRAWGDVRTPLWAGIVASVVNVFMNWVLIYGNLGAPALGVVGAAIASNIAIAVMMLHILVLFLARRLVVSREGGSWRPDFDLQRRIFRIGLPAGVESGLFQTGLMLFQRIMAIFGTSVIAAYNIGSTLLSLSFIPGVGFSLAASTLVGQYLGARDSEGSEREGWRSMWMAVGAMTAIGILLAMFARPIAQAFTEDPEVIELTVLVLTIFGFAHPFMAVEFALGGALRGAGDTIFPMVCVFSGLVVVRLGFALVLVEFFDAPIEWVWSVLILDYLVKGVLFVSRFRGGAWKRRVV